MLTWERGVDDSIENPIRAFLDDSFFNQVNWAIEDLREFSFHPDKGIAIVQLAY
jgi:hypothetical protein